MVPASSNGHHSRVLIVDDHPIVRRGVAQLISEKEDLEVCGEAETAPRALELLRELDPDVVLLDLTLASGGGLGLIRDLKAIKPSVPILVLSVHDEAMHAERALGAGAMGYVMKHEATDRIVAAIHDVLRGEIYLSERMKARLLHRFRGDKPIQGSPLEALSDRELDVFHLVARGLSTREVAHELCLSTKTVETHLEHLKQKLGLRSGRELARYSMTWFMQQT